jgi:DNA-binding MarR family transcriptional regulator
MSEDGPLLLLDHFLPYLLNVLASRVSQELAGVYAERFGISIPEWRAIAHLAQNERVSVREIHARVDMDKSKVSRAAARLEAAGVIEKRVHADDRRLVQLSLTRKGHRLFNEIAPLALAYEREFLSQLSAEEERLFRAIVDRLLGHATAKFSPPEFDIGAGARARAPRSIRRQK